MVSVGNYEVFLAGDRVERVSLLVGVTGYSCLVWPGCDRFWYSISFEFLK